MPTTTQPSTQQYPLRLLINPNPILHPISIPHAPSSYAKSIETPLTYTFQTLSKHLPRHSAQCLHHRTASDFHPHAQRPKNQTHPHANTFHDLCLSKRTAQSPLLSKALRLQAPKLQLKNTHASLDPSHPPHELSVNFSLYSPSTHHGGHLKTNLGQSLHVIEVGKESTYCIDGAGCSGIKSKNA